MSEFHSGKYRDIDFESFPCGFRKFFLFRYFPYWTAQKIKFKIRMNPKSGKKLIYDIPIVISRTSEDWNTKLKEDENCVLSEDKSEITITTHGLYGADVLKYYLGTPSLEGSVRVVELQANWKDKIWFIIFGLAGGFIGSLIIFLLGLLFEFIRINPAWDVFLNP